MKGDTLSEGDILEYMTVNGPRRGYVVDIDGTLVVAIRDGKTLGLDDILGSAQLRVTGKANIY